MIGRPPEKVLDWLYPNMAKACYNVGMNSPRRARKRLGMALITVLMVSGVIVAFIPH